MINADAIADVNADWCSILWKVDGVDVASVEEDKEEGWADD